MKDILKNSLIKAGKKIALGVILPWIVSKQRKGQ